MQVYQIRMRNLRIDHDLKQSDVAEILGTSSNQVGKYERGEQDMNIRHLITLANYYGVSADYILRPSGRKTLWKKQNTQEGSKIKMELTYQVHEDGRIIEESSCRKSKKIHEKIIITLNVEMDKTEYERLNNKGKLTIENKIKRAFGV